MRRTEYATRLAVVFVASHVLSSASVTGQAQQPAPADATPHKEELSETYRGSQQNNVEYQKVAPFKVFDNLYYVGPGFVSVWLIPTPDGLLLLDTAQEPYVDHVIDSIRKVGFDPRTIKYIVLSHGHLDHFGGAGRIQQLSGAHVVALEEDWALIEAAGGRSGRGNAPPPLVSKRDRVVKEGDTLTLGNTTLKFYRHPGHTPGSLSSEFIVFDGGRPYKAFMFGGPGPRGGETGTEQFLASANRVAEIPGIQVHVQVHSWLNDFPYTNGGIFERAQKLAERKPGGPHPFVDPQSWQTWVKKVQEGAQKRLEEERRKAAAAK